MKRFVLTLSVGTALAGTVFLLAALIAAPNFVSPGNERDAWNCFWAAGSCFVLSAMCGLWVTA